MAAGPGSVHSLMVLKLVPRTEQSAAQAVGLQKTQPLLKFFVSSELFFSPAMNKVLLSLALIVLTVLPGRF